MKYLGLSFLLFFGFAACDDAGSGEPDPELERMRLENVRLTSEKQAQDSTLSSLFGAMDEIDRNLDEIKEKEGVLASSVTDPELQKTKQEQIVEDIKFIQDLMLKNKERISTLNSQLKNSKVNIAGLNSRIERMVQEIQSKDADISELQQQLFKVNDQLEYLFIEYNERIRDLAGKDDQLSTAFYAYGTFKELQENGVVTKEGGFIGIGRSEKLSADFNKQYFKQIDTRDVTEIPLVVKKAKLVTNHPTDSYALEGEGKVDKLVIKDAAKFWTSSKYLVIVVE